MPDISPTPVDLDAIEDRWLQMCPSCDAGMSMTCQCPTGDPRNVISNLVDEIRRLRTSIGPDSERIRELEAENERLTRALYDALYTLHPTYGSTAGPSGGIGGQALTSFCAITQPHTDEHYDVLAAVEGVLNETAERRNGKVPPALRAAGLLPGSGDIVVSREAVRVVVWGEQGTQERRDALYALAAALSQPRPEETP